jgi:hypothetical protein
MGILVGAFRKVKVEQSIVTKSKVTSGVSARGILVRASILVRMCRDKGTILDSFCEKQPNASPGRVGGASQQAHKVPFWVLFARSSPMRHQAVSLAPATGNAAWALAF